MTTDDDTLRAATCVMYREMHDAAKRERMSNQLDKFGAVLDYIGRLQYATEDGEGGIEGNWPTKDDYPTFYRALTKAFAGKTPKQRAAILAGLPPTVLPLPDYGDDTAATLIRYCVLRFHEDHAYRLHNQNLAVATEPTPDPRYNIETAAALGSLQKHLSAERFANVARIVGEQTAERDAAKARRPKARTPLSAPTDKTALAAELTNIIRDAGVTRLAHKYIAQLANDVSWIDPERLAARRAAAGRRLRICSQFCDLAQLALDWKRAEAELARKSIEHRAKGAIVSLRQMGSLEPLDDLDRQLLGGPGKAWKSVPEARWTNRLDELLSEQKRLQFAVDNLTLDRAKFSPGSIKGMASRARTKKR